MIVLSRFPFFAVIFFLSAMIAFAQELDSKQIEEIRKLVDEKNYAELEKQITKGNVNKLFIDGDSLLTKAIEKNDRKLFDLVIQKGIDLNLQNDDFYGSTPLMACSGYENLEFAKILLSKGADVNKQDKSGDPAIHWSAYSGQIVFTELFLDNGAKTDLRSIHGGGAMDIALKEYQNSITDLLVYRGKGTFTQSPETRKLAYAVKNNDREYLSGIIKSINVNQTDEAGTPILLLAAERGFVDVVKLLIENGADINVMNAVGHTAINRAVFFGKNEVIDLLLAKNADVNKTDSRFALTPLMAAARKNRFQIGEKLIKNGADINKTNGIDNFTPILWAVYADNFDFVEMILKYNPDLSVVSKYETDVFKVAKGKTKTILETHRIKQKTKNN